jgi:hypothetical protein
VDRRERVARPEPIGQRAQRGGLRFEIGEELGRG